jgi:hypothetical protein
VETWPRRVKGKRRIQRAVEEAARYKRAFYRNPDAIANRAGGERVL